MTVVFEEGSLRPGQSLPAHSADVREYLEELLKPGIAQDHRFVYYLMASKGVCVVPLSSFCCDEMGFRLTLLEQNPEKRQRVYQAIADGIKDYLSSC
jgi:aspartate/methionine/tyrosine aminotransferase